MRDPGTRSKRQPLTALEHRSKPRRKTASPRYADLLAALQLHNASRRKGERTRDRLRLAAVQALEQRGYLQLRVADICKKAKVSPAVFYLYYPNKEAITVEVLSEFLRHTFGLDEAPEAPRPRRALFTSLVAKNLSWISALRANAGLGRCLLQLADQVPEFKVRVSQTNHQWYLLISEKMLERLPAVEIDRNSLLLAVYALCGMVDEICRKLLVSNDEHLVAIAGAAVADDHALAEFISLLWYRALFACDPPQLQHEAAKQLRNLRNAPQAASVDE
jgi:AcrR family transcriptional regulator